MKNRKMISRLKAYNDFRCECGTPLMRGRCPNCDDE